MIERVSASVLDDSIEYSLGDLCVLCRLDRDHVVEIVAEGIVEPLGVEPHDWRFSGSAVVRIQRIVRLQEEFAVNLAGAALALELLEEIERLRRRLGR